MGDITKILTQRQIDTITSSSYYHLKHYGELGGLDAQYFQMKMEYSKEIGKEYLAEVIEQQKEKERSLLAPLFSIELDSNQLLTLGYSQNQVNTLMNSFLLGKQGDIEEKIAFLNLFSGLSLYVPDENADSLGQVQRVIEGCFDSNGAVSFPFRGGLEDYEIFVSGLVGVFNALSEYGSQHENDGLISPIINTVLSKLKYLISYYQKDYEKRARERQAAAKSLEQLFTSKQFSTFQSVKKGRKWSKLLQAKGDFNMVKTVLKDSASGFLQQKGGKDYEFSIAHSLAEDIGKILSSITYGGAARGTVVGTGKDILGKYQKADIKIDINISGQTSVSNTDYSLTFSVKKSANSTNSIQIHHGGSLFAYAARLSGQELGLDFLNDGQFQYVFVNEFQKKRGETDFVKAFRDVLVSFGFYFLGQEVQEGTGGADFLYVSNKIISFSSVLEKALINSDIFETALRFSEKRSVEKKIDLMKDMDQKGMPYYSSDFISKSIDIGKESIYGTAFTLKLKKSALNL